MDRLRLLSERQSNLARTAPTLAASKVKWCDTSLLCIGLGFQPCVPVGELREGRREGGRATHYFHVRLTTAIPKRAKKCKNLLLALSFSFSLSLSLRMLYDGRRRRRPATRARLQSGFCTQAVQLWEKGWRDCGRGRSVCRSDDAQVFFCSEQVSKPATTGRGAVGAGWALQQNTKNLIRHCGIQECGTAIVIDSIFYVELNKRAMSHPVACPSQPQRLAPEGVR